MGNGTPSASSQTDGEHTSDGGQSRALMPLIRQRTRNTQTSKGLTDLCKGHAKRAMQIAGLRRTARVRPAPQPHKCDERLIQTRANHVRWWSLDGRRSRSSEGEVLLCCWMPEFGLRITPVL